MGMSQADMLKVHLAQAKGERTTLEGRVRVTKESIDTLQQALSVTTKLPSDGTVLEAHKFSTTDRQLEMQGILLGALIKTNLTQLKANLEEGMTRIEYLDKSIKAMESQSAGLITNPGMTLRRPGRG